MLRTPNDKLKDSTRVLTEDTSHALIDGPGQSDPVSRSDVVGGLLLAAELLVTEETLQLLLTQTHHLFDFWIELFHLPFTGNTFTKYEGLENRRKKGICKYPQINVIK